MKRVLFHNIVVRKIDNTTKEGPRWWYAYWLPHSSGSCVPSEVHDSVERDLKFEVYAYGVEHLISNDAEW